MVAAKLYKAAVIMPPMNPIAPKKTGAKYDRKNSYNNGWRSCLLGSDGSSDDTKHCEEEPYQDANSAIKHAEHFAERKHVDSFNQH
jgi:hypothetical protein